MAQAELSRRGAAERIRQGVTEIAVALNTSLHFSISIGMVEIDGMQDIRQLMSAADAAMYCAKNLGRNRVVCAPTTGSAETHNMV